MLTFLSSNYNSANLCVCLTDTKLDMSYDLKSDWAITTVHIYGPVVSVGVMCLSQAHKDGLARSENEQRVENPAVTNLLS